MNCLSYHLSKILTPGYPNDFLLIPELLLQVIINIVISHFELGTIQKTYIFQKSEYATQPFGVLTLNIFCELRSCSFGQEGED